MLVLRKNIVSSIIAAKLALILMFPLIVQFAHSLEGHDHAVFCTDKSLHFHKKNIDCKVCDFHFTSFTYNFTDSPDFYQRVYFDKTEELYSVIHDSFNPTTIQLRGPPKSVA